MIAYTGSRILEDEKIVFVGTGLPIMAAIHAQLTHAPNLFIIFEAGPLAPFLDMGMPLSVGDTRACAQGPFPEGFGRRFRNDPAGIFGLRLHRRAQIDMHGNICSTMRRH